MTSFSTSRHRMDVTEMGRKSAHSVGWFVLGTGVPKTNQPTEYAEYLRIFSTIRLAYCSAWCQIDMVAGGVCQSSRKKCYEFIIHETTD